MTTLTQISITTRKSIRYGIFFIIFLVVGRIVLLTGIGIYRKIFPPPLPPPEVSFSKLPKLPFPTKEKPTKLTLTIETPEGGLPKLATQAKVFFMPKSFSNLLSLDVAKEKAGLLGFSAPPEQLSETVYRFKNKALTANLEINIITGVFSVSYDLKLDSTPLSKRPPLPEIAATSAKTFLSSADFLPEDLDGPVTHEFLKLEQGKFVPALALSEANLVKVNLFRESFDELPSLTPDPEQANVWFTVSGATEKEKQIIAGEFHYFPVDESKSSTYPIKTSEKAWEELTNGEEFIASMGANKDGDEVKIRRVYLAYYDAGVPTDFFQPIIVFEGDKGFKAYVPAVTTDYYGE